MNPFTAIPEFFAALADATAVLRQMTHNARVANAQIETGLQGGYSPQALEHKDDLPPAEPTNGAAKERPASARRRG